MSSRSAYVLVVAIIGLALFASGTPAPLYATYRELWGFSSLVVTLVFAMYAFGVLGALLLAGRISDEVGRRPVLIASLAALMGTTMLFILANSVVWLFVARGLQGIATGLALGAASAAMLDLHPRRDSARVALANGIVSMAGMGLGVLVAAIFVELLPAPRVLPYVALMVFFAVAFVGALRMPEPVPVKATKLRLTPQRPSVPPVVRRPFFLACLGVLSSWSIGGIFQSLGPQLASQLFDTNNHIVSALPFLVLAVAAAASQLAFGNVTPWLGACAGSVVLAVGMLTIVLGEVVESIPLFFLGAVVGGAGFGLAFLCALRTLTAAIPPAHRAEVMSAFYLAAYLSLALPAIAAGVLTGPLGIRSTFEIFGCVISGVALIVATEAWRTRPRAPAAAPVIIST